MLAANVKTMPLVRSRLPEFYTVEVKVEDKFPIRLLFVDGLERKKGGRPRDWLAFQVVAAS